MSEKKKQKHLITFLSLGQSGIKVRFPNLNFFNRALQRTFLTTTFDKELIGEIVYIKDDSVSDLVPSSYPPNAMYINRQELGPDHFIMLMKMFNQFTVSLDIQKRHTSIRYPSNIPFSLLLDDVLQAALQPILERIGGFILHGSCMVKRTNAVVLMGNSGSGKSTTAFNLTRFGYHCYADDAVLVTPKGLQLWVWPFTRELSLRTMSFRLFQEQGINLKGYCKEGEKYYFRQNIAGTNGTVLKYICFTDVCGENATTITYLSREETLERLHLEKRHFSFPARNKAKVFAKILVEKVPVLLSVQVGMDLEAQGKTFMTVLSGNEVCSGQKSQIVAPGRAKKIALLRRGWSNPDKEPLADLIPLLGDYDLKIFASALAFFQNYHLSHIDVLNTPIAGIKTLDSLDATMLLIPWLRTKDWISGTKRLIVQSRSELLEQYAFSWIKSAPILYPFLKTLTVSDPHKNKVVEQAWEHYQRERLQKSEMNAEKSHPCTEIHIGNSKVSFSNQNFQRIWLKVISNAKEDHHIQCWISRNDEKERKSLVELLKTSKNSFPVNVTVIPLGHNNKIQLDTAIKLVRLGIEYGLRIFITRSIPLCRLTNTEARFLLENSLFATGNTITPIERLYITDKGLSRIKKESEFFHQFYLGNNRFKLRETPFDNCTECALCPLGLCKGKFKWLI